jgi:hypothetical protein
LQLRVCGGNYKSAPNLTQTSGHLDLTYPRVRFILAGFASCGWQVFDLEVEAQQVASQTSDFQERVAAFLQKQKPSFTGK